MRAPFRSFLAPPPADNRGSKSVISHVWSPIQATCQRVDLIFFRFFVKQTTKNNNFQRVEPVARFARHGFGKIEFLLTLLEILRNFSNFTVFLKNKKNTLRSPEKGRPTASRPFWGSWACFLFLGVNIDSFSQFLVKNKYNYQCSTSWALGSLRSRRFW